MCVRASTCIHIAMYTYVHACICIVHMCSSCSNSMHFFMRINVQCHAMHRRSRALVGHASMLDDAHVHMCAHITLSATCIMHIVRIITTAMRAHTHDTSCIIACYASHSTRAHTAMHVATQKCILRSTFVHMLCIASHIITHMCAPRTGTRAYRTSPCSSY